jgi:phosphate transport system protein
VYLVTGEAMPTERPKTRAPDFGVKDEAAQ